MQQQPSQPSSSEGEPSSRFLRFPSFPLGFASLLTTFPIRTLAKRFPSTCGEFWSVSICGGGSGDRGDCNLSWLLRRAMSVVHWCGEVWLGFGVEGYV